MLSEWLLPLIINCYLIANLANTMTSSFSHSVVVCLRLRDVILRNWIGIGADYLFTLITKHLSPSFDAVVADTLSDIIPIEAHPWYKHHIKLVIVSFILAVLNYKEKGTSTKARGVPNLRPVITEAFGY